MNLYVEMEHKDTGEIEYNFLTIEEFSEFFAAWLKGETEYKTITIEKEVK